MNWKQAVLRGMLIFVVSLGIFVSIVLYQTRDLELPHKTEGQWLPVQSYESALEQRYYCDKDGRYIGNVYQKSEGDWQATTDLTYAELDTPPFKNNVSLTFDTVNHAKEAVEKFIQEKGACK